MTRKQSATPAPLQKLRCAVYTRKSSEEGLEMEFNSLEAQRDACEAYVASQLAERARREAKISRRRQREAERIYEFSQQMLVTGNVIDLLKRSLELSRNPGKVKSPSIAPSMPMPSGAPRRISSSSQRCSANGTLPSRA